MILMFTVTIVVIVVAVIVVAVLAIAVVALRRRRQLQQRFGPEYDRLAGEDLRVTLQYYRAFWSRLEDFPGKT
jgi:protein-S-isoprenylcysteine O-methyltransferase Ste14